LQAAELFGTKGAPRAHSGLELRVPPLLDLDLVIDG
jgi:hypothetical protein